MNKFRIGDIVIKVTGGNKMRISEAADNKYNCIWFVESTMHEKIFDEDEIVTLDEYKEKYIKIEEREDKINQIFKEN